ncbi:MAG: ribonuclease R [Flavobacteriales bacterium]
MSKYIRKKKSKFKKSKKSKKSSSIRQALVDFLKENPKQNHSLKQCFKATKSLTKEQKERLVDTLKALLESGEIVENKSGEFAINQNIKSLEGTIEVHSSGRAHFLMDEGDDISIGKKHTGQALNKDQVRIEFLRNAEGDIQNAQVVEVLKRFRETYIGIFEDNGKHGFVQTQKVGRDFFIRQSKRMGAKDGDRVEVKLSFWEKSMKNPNGEIIKVLGKAGDHQSEIHGILASYGLPTEFPAEVEKEAERFSEELTKSDLKTRRDFRTKTTFTIDPHDAKDFDDALSIEQLGDDLWEVGIHIADVSYYLDQSPILEKEAQERATSIYLVDRVIPMLPESLSNGLCSLRPDETKRCFSVVVQLNKRATVKSVWIGRTLIHSDKRFTYEQAQEIIENQAGEYVSELTILDKMAKIMRNKRMKNGAIAFDREEMRFRLDENKHPIGVYMKRSKDAHKLVEEFMLLANRSVGESIGKVKAKKDQRTFVYRIHDKPDEEKLSHFSDFVQKLGFDFQLDKSRINNSLNSILDEVKSSPFASAIENIALRSMSKATYSTKNIGHYGLGFSHYSHFTSPIRRYPDVMAHRLIQSYLDGKSSANAETYEALCKHSSSMEKLAVEAERDSVKFMQAKYLEDKVGKTFEAHVSGISEHGIYAELDESKCEGMIRLSSIRSEHFRAFPQEFLVEGNQGRIIRFGDPIKAQIKAVDIIKKQVDMLLVD